MHGIHELLVAGQDRDGKPSVFVYQECGVPLRSFSLSLDPESMCIANGLLVVIESCDGCVSVVDLKDGSLRQRLKLHELDDLTDICASPDPATGVPLFATDYTSGHLRLLEFL